MNIDIIKDAYIMMGIQPMDYEKGVNMCNALKKLQNAGKMEGKMEERIEAIVSMLEFGITKEQILTKYSEDEYNKAKEKLSIKNK